MPPRQSVAQIVAAQLAALVPNIVNQVTAAIQQNPPPHNQNNNNNNHNDQGNNQANQDNINQGINQQGNNPNGCSYSEFLKCKPKEYDGKNGAVVLTRWIEKMEAVFDISNCAEHNKVRFASSSLINKALTWWNTQIQARGREAAVGMTWDEFKALMTEEFCPSNEMKKLEQELWDLSMEGANHAAYTDRFHELAKLVPHLVTPESKRITRYINGLAPQVRAIVTGTEPTTIHSAIVKAGAVTDELVRSGDLTRTGGKRKDMGESSRSGGRNGNNNKRGKTDNYAGTTETRNLGYIGNAPKCDKCNFHHYRDTQCRVCTNCHHGGHLARDCRARTKAAPINTVRPRGCYGCGSTDHYRSACPKLQNQPKIESGRQGQQPRLEQGKQNQGNQGNQPRGRAYVLGANDAGQDQNTVAGNGTN